MSLIGIDFATNPKVYVLDEYLHGVRVVSVESQVDIEKDVAPLATKIFISDVITLS